MITLTRNKLFVVIYCLMITAWACTLAVTAGADESLPSKTVRYSDLDISKPDGAKTLYQRIRAAARHVCDLSIGGDAVLRVAEKACVDTAIDNAVRKVDAPALTSLRFGGDIHLASK
jgi:UrcA family protein